MTPDPNLVSSAFGADSALLRAKVIRRSLTCHVLGWCSLVPWVGLPCALLAWRQGSAARVEEKETWNPARRYRVLGLTLAALGVTMTILSFAVALLGCWGSR